MTFPGAQIPIPAFAVNLDEFKTLNGNLDFRENNAGGERILLQIGRQQD
jgi:hypothetical protein